MDTAPKTPPSPAPAAPNPPSSNGALTCLVLLVGALTIAAFVYCIRALRPGMDYERDLRNNSRLIAQMQSTLATLRTEADEQNARFDAQRDKMEATSKDLEAQIGNRAKALAEGWQEVSNLVSRLPALRTERDNAQTARDNAQAELKKSKRRWRTPSRPRPKPRVSATPHWPKPNACGRRRRA